MNNLVRVALREYFERYPWLNINQSHAIFALPLEFWGKRKNWKKYSHFIHSMYSHKENSSIPSVTLVIMSKSIDRCRSVLFVERWISNCVLCACMYACVCKHGMQYDF